MINCKLWDIITIYIRIYFSCNALYTYHLKGTRSIRIRYLNFYLMQNVCRIVAFLSNTQLSRKRQDDDILTSSFAMLTIL